MLKNVRRFGSCEVVAMDFDQMVEQYHQAMEEFTRANPKPVIALFSQRDDGTLAGGMGGVSAARSRSQRTLR
jgi:hypothetical protein